MTKVEELREGILGVCDVFVRPQSEAELIEVRIADLISAAHAEGVAEGAEQERERIREAGFEVDMYTNWHRTCLSNVHEKGTVFVVPVSALAPEEPQS